MLQVSYIRENKEEVLERLAVKNFNQTELVDQIIQLDDQRKSTQVQADELLAKGNVAAKQIGELMRNGKKEAAEVIKAETSKSKEDVKALQEELSKIEEELYQKLVQLPNLPH
ncbi:MAG TPA: serine--tRNA ligase, partial [Pelobium sp.]|nr:serine--tRNA ligase [Pelobium sp.]